MSLYKFPEKGRVGEVKEISNFLDAHVAVLQLVFDLLDACICQLWLGMLFRNIHCVCHNGFDLQPNGTLERGGCDFDN